MGSCLVKKFSDACYLLTFSKKTYIIIKNVDEDKRKRLRFFREKSPWLKDFLFPCLGCSLRSVALK